MSPEFLSVAAFIVSVTVGGLALYQQRQQPKPTTSQGDLESLSRRNTEMTADIALTRERIQLLENQRASLEASFARQVATLLAELSETRTNLATTQFELSAALDELDRLHRRLDDDHAKAPRPSLTVPARRIRVLGIWPDTDLDPLANESAALSNAGISYQGLIGNVTRRDILRELRRANGQAGYNLIHIGSHGQETDPDRNQAGGILLSQGDLAAPGWWGQIAGTYSIQAAVLMTCEGDDVADALRRAGVAGVVAASRELADKAAVAFSFALYENLAEGLGLADAVKQATWVLSGNQADMIRLIGTDPWGK